MSIAKKRSKNANTEPLRKKSHKMYVVTESAMRNFIGSLSISEIDAAAARLQSVADVTGRMLNRPVDRISQYDLQLIKRLPGESNNRHYQKIMKAIIAALEQGPQGIKNVHLTASRIVELAFRWTLEYFAAFDLYRDKLGKMRQQARDNRQAVGEIGGVNVDHRPYLFLCKKAI